VTLTVDEYVTRYRIPVTVVTKGDAPEGFYATAPATDPPMIAVSGPRTIVQQIVSAQVIVDQASLPAQEGTVRRALPFNLVDEKGAVISSDMLQVTSESVLVDSIVVEQELYMLKQVPLSDVGVIRGEPAQGYEIKSWKITPDMLTIAAPRDTLSGIDAMFTDSYVDVTGMTDSINKSLRVRLSDVEYSSATTASVVVEIGPVITGKDFSNLRITLRNVPENLRASLDRNVTGLTITGPQLVLESLRSKNITLSVNAEGLTAGEHTVPVEVTVDNEHAEEFQYSFTNSTVVLTLSEK
jgi:YbbR domain-containing protein